LSEATSVFPTGTWEEKRAFGMLPAVRKQATAQYKATFALVPKTYLTHLLEK